MEESIGKKIDALIAKGATQKDIVILSQYAFEEPIRDIPIVTIAAYRGMEAPIIFVLPDITTDDNTLACALARCTTMAILIVDIGIFAGDVKTLSSQYLREKIEAKQNILFEADRKRLRPVFLENIIVSCGRSRAEHTFAGVTFFYSESWKSWISSTPSWPNSASQIWGIFLETFIGAKIYGLNFKTNRLGVSTKIEYCMLCSTLTPHCIFYSTCLPCNSIVQNVSRVDQVIDIMTSLNSSSVPGFQSILNVLSEIASTENLYDNNVQIGNNTRALHLLLTGTLICFKIQTPGQNVSQNEIYAWLQKSMVASEFELDDDQLVKKAISSLCSRKIMVKTAPGQYSVLTI